MSAPWFAPLCTATAPPLVANCPTSVDGQHWCSDLPAHADLHSCLCGARFTGSGLVRIGQDRFIA